MSSPVTDKTDHNAGSPSKPSRSVERWTHVEVAPDRAGELPGWRGLSDRPPELRSVKEEAITRILTGRLPFARGELYVKLYRLRGLASWRTLGLSSRAEREFHNLSRVARSGVPVTIPAAWGERRRGLLRPDCFVVTESFAGAVPVKQLLMESTTERRFRSQLLSGCGVALAGIHRAGLVHNRSSLKNYLWVRGQDHAIVCDLPYGFVTGGSCEGTWWALGDLVELVGARRYRGLFSRGDVYRTLLGYCGDSNCARQLYRRFRRWQWLWSRRASKEVVLGVQRLIGRWREKHQRGE